MIKKKVSIQIKVTCMAIMASACILGACGANDEALVVDNSGSEVSTDTEVASVAEQTYFANLPTDVENSSIFVEKIEGLPDDFIRGMDISSLLAEEASGVKFYDADGSEADLMRLLADAGVNCVRVRVWNDPFDSEGNGYGGGNCTADTASEIGRRAAQYGIKLLVDFHYSDFWADPNKQFAPKEWKDLDLVGKSDAIRSYTHDSLAKIIEAGADVYMVQIGNEINTGMAGEGDFDDVTELLRSASDSVRDINDEYGRNILVAVHYTNIDNPEGTIEVAEKYASAGLDYDVFGVSYYPYWHGTLDNMRNVLTSIHNQYGVDTCILETAYMYTDADGDGSPNSVSEADALEEYPVSIQGQANCIRDVMATAYEAGAIGVFYWEGAWIPVGKDKAANAEKWEKYGSGWASSYAKEYDPEDAGKYYGGSSWDNQAFFDNDGNKLDSLDVFKYVYHGAVGEELLVLSVTEPEIVLGIGEELQLPETIKAIYNDTSVDDEIVVIWNDSDLELIDTSIAGEYTISGTIDTSESMAQCSLDTINAKIIVEDINYVMNPGFEDEDASMWIVESTTGEDPTDIQDKSSDAYNGSKAFHYWSEQDMEFTLSQEIIDLNPGTYSATCFMQGGDFDDTSEINLFVKVIDGDQITEYKSETVMLDGWVNWKNPEINDVIVPEGAKVVIGVYTKACAKAWATYDDFAINSR